VEQGIVKISLPAEVNEVGFVVGHVIIQLNGNAAHTCGKLHLVCPEVFLVVKKEVNGVVLS